MESYEKIKEIGKGSYGVVWLVRNFKDRKNYVLKRIDLRKSSDRDKLSAEQEAQLLKSLKHPNIVSYKESFQTGGYLHIVMLFCEGGDLYSKIKEQNGKPIEEIQIVEWFVQITMALQYMHEKCILHRDLKTQNIFLTRNKIIKVGDLGIARVLKSNTDMATTIIGTPYYMSPELFSNKPYNSKSDVWALGCCVYEMTTLKHAFNAKDMSSLVFKITRGKMPEIPSIYSKEFVSLIKSMLNPDPKLRPTANKILRDPFIKKNIFLFLERTKLKQQEQLNKDLKPIEESKEVKNIAPVVQKPQPVRSEFSNFNKIEKEIEPKLLKNELNHQKIAEQNPIIEKKRVQFNSDPVKIVINNNYSDSDEEREPYKLTKPVKLEPEKEIVKIETPTRVQPKIVSIGVPNRSRITSQQLISDIQNKPSSSSIEDSNSAALSARERRRQRLKLSQSDSSSNIAKPPLLKKLPLKSDDFGKNKNIQTPIKPVSKSLNDNESNLKDSLKIIRQNIDKIAPVSESANMYQQQNKLDRDPFFAKKNSSSSSSSISSNEENDPNKYKLRIEKRERKDKKETDNLIDALTLTLKTIVNISDLKDDVIDDFDEEGDILEEVSFNQAKKNDLFDSPKRNNSSSSVRSLNEREPIIMKKEKNSISFMGANHMYKKIKEAE
ncbi:unnamed protein product, partial [Brachionus calyciflorus]